MKATVHQDKKNPIFLEPLQWSSLQHIDDVTPLSAADYQVLDEVRHIISKHGYENRFGITLLHKHFDLNDNEVLLEETDEETRTSISRAAPDPGPENTIETMWRFSKESTETVTKCVKRCHYFMGHKLRHAREGY